MSGKSVLLLAGLLSVLCATAAPFAEWFDVSVRAGGTVRLWGEGDEYSASFETEAGYAVGFDPSRLAYFYLVQEADGSLVFTDLELGAPGAADAIAARAKPHLRDTSEKARAARRKRIAEDDELSGRAARWANLKQTTRRIREAKEKGLLMAPPKRPTVGTVKGLTILVDFPISKSSETTWSKTHKSVTAGDLDSLLNGDNCTLYGNASSVRKYYLDVSNGRLDYSNAIIGPILMPKPRSDYDDARYKNGICAGWLIGDAFEAIRNSADYESKYLPILQSLSVQDGTVRSLNIWFAGAKAEHWSYGLWAHKSTLSSSVADKLTFEVGGSTVRFNTYQITPITTSPVIGTFCHENGHMLCGFPDFYNYEYGSGFGCGYFSLMYGAISSTNPEFDDPYLRTAAGWLEPKVLPHLGGTVTVAANHKDVWRYDNPANPEEYYLIENRQKSGRDADLPAAGVLIWHCNEAGSNTYPAQLDNFPFGVCRLSNELSLEQADGLYHLERIKSNTGEIYDAWYAGNPRFCGAFAADTLPCAKWDDGTDSGLALSEFSENGDVMTFRVAPYTDGRPANDDFADARRILTKKGGEVCSSEGATKETGEPNHAGKSTATASVWWTFTAKCSGSVTLDTRGSAIGTCLAVYTGSSVESLTAVASDAASDADYSSVTFTVTAATAYHIAVTGLNRTNGDVVLNWEMDLNDDSRPDLVPYNLFVSKVTSGGDISYASTEFTTSDPIYFSYRCSNDGVVTASGTCKTRFRLYNASGDVVKTDAFSQTYSLSAEHYYYANDRTSFNGLGLPPGRYTLVYESDYANGIEESDETNNRTECSFTVRYPSTVATPTVSPGTSEFEDSVTVSMACETSGATIRYTQDGTIPTERSAVYGAPISICDDTVVKVRAFKPEMNPSEVVVTTYSRPRTLENVLGTEGVTWENDLSVPWRAEDAHTMRTGGISNRYTSTLKATVKGKGRLTFSYKACSYSGNNKFIFSLNGVQKFSKSYTEASGTDFYGTETYEITNDDESTFQWTYKVGSSTAGSSYFDYSYCGIWLFSVKWEPQQLDPFPPVTPVGGQTEAEAVAAELAATFGADSEVVRHITTQAKLAEFNAFVKSCGILSATDFPKSQLPYAYSSFVLSSILENPMLLEAEPKLEITSSDPANDGAFGGWDFTVSLDTGSDALPKMVAEKLGAMIRVGTDVDDITHVPQVIGSSAEKGNPLTLTIARPGEKSGFIRVRVER